MTPQTLTLSILILTLALTSSSGALTKPTTTEIDLNNYYDVRESNNLTEIKNLSDKMLNRIIDLEIFGYRRVDNCPIVDDEGSLMDTARRVVCVIKRSLSYHEQNVLVIMATIYALFLIVFTWTFLMLLGMLWTALVYCWRDMTTPTAEQAVALNFETLKRISSLRRRAYYYPKANSDRENIIPGGRGGGATVPAYRLREV